MVLVVSVPQAAFAQSGDVVTKRWDVEINLHPDSTFTVRETLEIDVGDEPLSSGTRLISALTLDGIIDVRVFEDYTEYDLDTSRDLEQPGLPETFRLNLEGNNFRIDWYFEPETNVTRQFEVQYRVVGPLELERDLPVKLVWDAIPPGHTYPVEASTVAVNLLADTTLNTTDLAPAAYGFNGKAETSITDSQVVFEIGEVAPGSGVRVEVYFTLDEGFVLDVPFEEDPDDFAGVNLILFVLLLVLASIVGIGVVLIRKLRLGARHNQ